jgi:hypothetical protein
VTVTGPPVATNAAMVAKGSKSVTYASPIFRSS